MGAMLATRQIARASRARQGTGVASAWAHRVRSPVDGAREASFGHDLPGQERVAAVDASVQKSHRPASSGIAGSPSLRCADERRALRQCGCGDRVDLDVRDLGRGGKSLEIGFVDFQRQEWNGTEPADRCGFRAEHSTEYCTLRACNLSSLRLYAR